MNEKFLIVGLMVMVAVLIIVIISLVAALKQSRAKIRQSQKNPRMNDYNRDLLTAIREIGGDIQKVNYDLCGSNPLNPTSLIHWRLH